MRDRAKRYLGVDFGSTRVRVVAAACVPSGPARIEAAAAREVPDGTIRAERVGDVDLLAAILEDMRREVGPRIRASIFAVSPAAGNLRVVRFPAMGDLERRRAAALEAERFAPAEAEAETPIVRVHPVDRIAGLYAIGVARRAAVASRCASLRKAGLVPVAADHESCAQRRAFPIADAVLDVGLRESRIHAFAPNGNACVRLPIGGADVTEAIAADLRIDERSAEKRKRILGTAGAGENMRDRLVREIAHAIGALRQRHPVRRIAITGNGARLPGLAAALEASTEAIVEAPVSELLRGGAYPDDVARSAAPDWTLAAALAAWSAAG